MFASVIEEDDGMGCWSGPAEMVGDKCAKGTNTGDMKAHKIS